MTAREIESYFDIEPVAEEMLETPVPVVDLDVAERNIRRWQSRCDQLGIANRPHVKTHKLTGLARFQVDVGARGICVQKLGEAEVMADAGITDILMTFNLVGMPKLKRLETLARRTGISLVADNADVVAGIAAAGRSAGRAIDILVECETGAGRNGVQTPTAARELAELIDRTEGVRYGGLMTYPATGARSAGAAFLTDARERIAAAGLETRVVSTGGSPEMWSDEGLEVATEYRAGTNVYFDRSLIEVGACTLADCALTVRTTVVSVPTPERAILDAGSKALTSDLLGLPDFGCVPRLEDARLYTLNEEHGYLNISNVDRKPKVGEVLEVLPNHACPVSNLFDRVALKRAGRLLGLTRVDARGMVW
ncbi:alanine racemase [Aliiruegeria lutimaris]|uniref:D-serine deaminase, pyridoxal phosphate-dependent n=1 Tax=Aliiruegeria lutimaris TaxID=571298 RepID=A0A1G9HH93_9RHOB|nr:alanine racemase [Aliiruegeria lutimaris]SDL12222.1 D-serine deaminase, pyridoxal phosphate-dependent [Aliiruegeria lutimaris]